MVTSTSWPTALTVGTGQPTSARATTSSLNAHRSSRLPPPLGPEEDRVERGSLVLQGEIDVSRAGGRHVRDLALHQNVGKTALDDALDLPRQLGNRIDPRPGRDPAFPEQVELSSSRGRL